MRAFPTVLLVLSLLAGARAAAAQGVLHGRITDAVTGRGVGPALVTLLDLGRGGTRQGITTDSGFYRFPGVAAGSYRVQVELLGYAPALSLPRQIATGDTVQLSLRLTGGAIRLDSLQVEARARPGGAQPTLESFHQRRERGLGGTFITRAEIERRAPSQLWDMVRQQARTDRSLRNLMARRDPCQMELFVDGWNPRRGDTGEPLEDLLNRFSPNDIEGIEIYRNMSALPAELATPRAQECGVIAIWTRRGR